MLIQPDSYIRLIKNCPLDNKYEHTIYFNNPTEQEAYFKSLDGKPYIKQSYQRSGVGVITLQDSMANVYNCNYLMFNNLSFENKWFYAFVNKIEYVSNVVCKIYYEIDVVQTWFPFCTLEECFVEREHSATDAIGDNLVHENIYFGQYVFGNEVSPIRDGFTMDNLCFVVAYNPTLIDIVGLMGEAITDSIYQANVYGGCYQGVNFVVLDSNAETASTLRAFLLSLNTLTWQGIVSIFMYPKAFLPVTRGGYNEYNRRVLFYLNRNTSFDGYVPNNNKLFTYPYTCANLTSHRNEGNDFAFEYSSLSNALQFRATASFNASPNAIAYPVQYKGVSEFLEGSVSLGGYPLCTWGTDGFSDWLNNNLFRVGLSAGAALSGVAPATAVALTADEFSSKHPNVSLFPGTQPMEQVSEGGYTVDRDEATLGAIGLARAEMETGTVHSFADNDVVFGTPRGREIVARVKHITNHYARIVDDYFTRFGYATNKVKIPNVNIRPWWNYVKTVGCKLSGSVPAEDMRAIESLFDRGITFWNKNAQFGVYDYSVQNNSPVVEEE